MVKKKEVKKISEIKEEKGQIVYLLGLMSIIFSLFFPSIGLLFGIIGLFQNKKQTSELSKKGKKLNIIGIILSVVFFILSILISFYFPAESLNNLYQTSFPA